jgi:type I restriction enzyme S subunit
MDLPTQSRVAGHVPIVASNGVVGHHNHAPVKGPGVVIGRSGSIGGGQYLVSDFWPLNTTLWVKDFKGNDPRFCYYLLKSIDFSGMNAGSGVPTLNRNHLHPMPMVKPSFNEQKQIAISLGSIDDRITLLRETNKTLESIAQAIFKSWFVDFDPVHAKAKGIAPEGMDDATASLFPDSFEETELGKVPKGWALTPFGQHLAHTIGGDWGSDIADEKNDTSVFIIRGTDIPDLHDGLMNRVPFRHTSNKKLSTRRLQGGDIVIEVSGGSKDQPTGRSLFITNELLSRFGNYAVQPTSFCRLFRPHSQELGVFLSQHLIHIYDQGKTWEYQNQSTGIANFQTTHFLESELVVSPTNHLIVAFADLVKPMIQQRNSLQMSTLTSIRDTLLPRLISGQLRIEEAQEMVESV